MNGALKWDFEGLVSFLSPEEGGLADLPSMGYWPSFRYPEFDDETQFVARPVMVFKPDGKPYDAGERLASPVFFRFYFLNRELYETLHRARLVPERLFELTEGSRAVARGVVGRTRESTPAVEADIERLAVDLRDVIPAEDVKEVFAYVYHREWECALNSLWAVLSVQGATITPSASARLIDLGGKVDLDVDTMKRDFPIRITQE